MIRSWRINLVFALLFAFSVLIIGNLVYIQLFRYQYWRALAQGQQKFFDTQKGERGEIFFRDKTPLALNKNFDLVYAVPRYIKNTEETITLLSQVLSLPKSSLMKKIQKDTLYVVLKKKLTPEEVDGLKKINLPGIYLGKESGRYYLHDSLAARTIGFLGGNSKGQYGVEGFYDDILQGKENIIEKEKGPGGYFINNFSNSIQKGSDLILTIDYNIQFKAEKLLQQAKDNFGIEKGEIIVVDPNSGEILALANFPSFNPNNYQQIKNLNIFKNSAFQELFEPGSVFKPITMVAALDQHKITPQTTYVDKGFVQVGNRSIRNYGNRVWGKRTMTEVLEKSINTGAVFAQKQLGKELFLEYLERFGFFEPTGIDLQGEVFSKNKEFRQGYEINFATASFGQGIEVTSFQLIRAYSAIANGGNLLKPFIVKKVLQNGQVIEKKAQVQKSSIVSPEAASQVTLMLVSAVENGFSKRVKIPGYYIAGKTGTAQVPYENKRGYYPDKTIQSFVGFAPALNPQFLILVKLYNPKTKTAEYSAAPVFRELAKYIIDYWKIPPDYQGEKNELFRKN